MSITAALLAGSIISGLLGAGASTAGAILNRRATKEANQTNIDLQNAANDLSIHEADKNRAWQEMMSNTAHQREMADLKAAGLNPILAAGGGGASTPSPAAATAYSANVEPANFDLSGITNVLNSLSHTMLTQALINGDIMPSSTAKEAKNNAMADYYSNKSEYVGEAHVYKTHKQMVDSIKSENQAKYYYAKARYLEHKMANSSTASRQRSYKGRYN